MRSCKGWLSSTDYPLKCSNKLQSKYFILTFEIKPGKILNMGQFTNVLLWKNSSDRLFVKIRIVSHTYLILFFRCNLIFTNQSPTWIPGKTSSEIFLQFAAILLIVNVQSAAMADNCHTVVSVSSSKLLYFFLFLSHVVRSSSQLLDVVEDGGGTGHIFVSGFNIRDGQGRLLILRFTNRFLSNSK